MIEGILFAVGGIATLIVMVIRGVNKEGKSLNAHHPGLPERSEPHYSSSEAMLIAQLQKQISVYEDQRAKLREFGKKRIETEHENIDAVLLGPRSSGKTSLATLWASPLLHNEIPSATTRWQRYNVNLHEFKIIDRFDSLFDVERSFKKVLRLRLRDYPGEISVFPEAIKAIDELSSKTVVVFMMQIDYTNGNITGVAENAEYFNGVFVEQIQKGLKGILESVSKVFVVFNKADLLPPHWDKAEATNRVVQANNGPISFIKRAFGPLVMFHLVSVKNNFGIVSLLGDIGKIGIDGSDELPRFDSSVSNFGKRQI